MRILRMALALVIMYDAFQGETWWLMAVGGLFAYQALANIGCAGGNCTVPTNDSTAAAQSDIDIDYEEVK